jgi:hypothetical protein
VFLCEVLCDPLCFNDLILTTKGTKVNTKAHKGLFQQPHNNVTGFKVSHIGDLEVGHLLVDSGSEELDNLIYFANQTSIL